MPRTQIGRNSAWGKMAVAFLAGAVLLLPMGVTTLAVASPPTDACTASSRSLTQLAMIDNATDGSFQCLGVAVDGDTVTAFRVETHRFASALRRKDSEQIEIEEFPKSVVESSRGAVLDGVPGHDAIILRGHLSRTAARSELVTTFLYNGFTSEYRSCRIILDRTPNAGWHLVNGLDQTISHIMVKTRQIPILGTFGIANLEGACT
jgi:hypothetical protein